MRASLPMYARPELDAANDKIWRAMAGLLRLHGIAAPETLEPDGVGYAFWEDPRLLFSQTCGYPYRSRLRGKVSLIGTPDYGLPGCPPGHYTSALIARRRGPIRALGDLTGARFAFNERDSQSGYQGPLAFAAYHGAAPLPVLQTGSHRASALAVLEGRADCAVIDAVTFRLMQTYDPFN